MSQLEEDYALSNRLLLKAPNKFIKDYASEKFFTVIEKYCRELNYEFALFTSIIAKENMS
ncbi:MAG TPA: hypothetical protein LFW20_01225 [Rickettsia endosymbiont of Omalisus fontisbellaquei]|nr:hypothetical protein [Rickettsia endosymbiont of Omalisus fontisbellaquei]